MSDANFRPKTSRTHNIQRWGQLQSYDLRRAFKTNALHSVLTSNEILFQEQRQKRKQTNENSKHERSQLCE